ncbi:MAG: beta-ketoacyl-[acyl-carrier-protein] synthase family protein [Sphingobium sp.]
MSDKVVITGMGCISGLGKGIEANWRRLQEGQGAIRPLARQGMDGVAAWIEPESLAGSERTENMRRLGKLDPISLYALEAAQEAVEQANLVGHTALARRTAILMGCGSGGNATNDAAYERLFGRGQNKVHPQTIPSSMITAPTAHVAMLFGVHGPTFTLSSACASSAHALGEAMHMIRAGRVDVAIAGGAEACLSLGSWVGWQSLGVLAPDTCRPFSWERKGMVLGEGAAVLVLESENHALERGANVLGELAGYGASSDAAHMTAPDLDGMTSAILQAHSDADLDPTEPVLISAHGTGTILNDAAETKALHTVYGKALVRHKVIATKSAHGHMIGAGGAIEFLLGMKALKEGIIPPTLNYLGPDPDCDAPLALTSERFEADTLVSNSFAFGGLNAVLIGRRA